jgi:gamma-tubulin complex component 3
MLFLRLQVLECSWEKLESRINTKTIDLDAVIEAHAHYLYEIAHKGFLAGLKGAPPLSMQLNAIFDVILAYNTILVKKTKGDMTHNQTDILLGSAAWVWYF